MYFPNGTSGYPNIGSYSDPNIAYPNNTQATYPQLDYSSSQPGYSSSQPGYSSSQPGYSSSQPGYSSSHTGYSASPINSSSLQNGNNSFSTNTEPYGQNINQVSGTNNHPPLPPPPPSDPPPALPPAPPPVPPSVPLFAPPFVPPFVPSYLTLATKPSPNMYSSSAPQSSLQGNQYNNRASHFIPLSPPPPVTSHPNSNHNSTERYSPSLSSSYPNSVHNQYSTNPSYFHPASYSSYSNPQHYPDTTPSLPLHSQCYPHSSANMPSFSSAPFSLAAIPSGGGHTGHPEKSLSEDTGHTISSTPQMYSKDESNDNNDSKPKAQYKFVKSSHGYQVVSVDGTTSDPNGSLVTPSNAASEPNPPNNCLSADSHSLSMTSNSSHSDQVAMTTNERLLNIASHSTAPSQLNESKPRYPSQTRDGCMNLMAPLGDNASKPNAQHKLVKSVHGYQVVSGDPSSESAAFGSNTSALGSSTNSQWKSPGYSDNTAEKYGNSYSGGRTRGGFSGPSSRGSSHKPLRQSTRDTFKCSKMAPFKTDCIDNAPNTGQHIQCIVCDVSMPSYSIAHTHFNSPKHKRRLNQNAHFPSVKRQKLAASSESKGAAQRMECAPCGVRPGSFCGLVGHMTSPKHLRKINDIGPESRAFNVTCTPCKQQINTIEDLGIHCSSKQHGEIIAKQLKEKYPGLESNSSPWYCATCDKSCNSAQTFDTHLTSVKHTERTEKMEHGGKEKKPTVMVEREVVIPNLYQCKICNFASSDKTLIDKHYETPSHRANKLLKRRHDELYRVSDVSKSEYKGQDLGLLVPLNVKGPHHCGVCDLGFAHTLLLDIHKKGGLHRELQSKAEIIQEEAVNGPSEAALPISGHHCDACNLHTSCITVYIAHVSSKSHRKMMSQLAKRGVGSTTADPSDFKCAPNNAASRPASVPSKPASVPRKPASIPSKPASVPSKPASVPSKPASVPSKPASVHSKPASVPSKPPSVLSKPKTPPQKLQLPQTTSTSKAESADKEAPNPATKESVLPDDGIPPDAIAADGRYECKLCSVIVEHKQTFIQHCKGKRHMNKTRLAPSTAKIEFAVFTCKMCNVTCATGAETIAHLSSKEHMSAPASNGAGKKREEKVLDPDEITKKFLCEICNIDCRVDSAYQLHLKGTKHSKKVAAISYEAQEIIGVKRADKDMASLSVTKGLSCSKCEVHFKSQVNYEQHMESMAHKLKASKIVLPSNPQRANQQPDYEAKQQNQFSTQQPFNVRQQHNNFRPQQPSTFRPQQPRASIPRSYPYTPQLAPSRMEFRHPRPNNAW